MLKGQPHHAPKSSTVRPVAAKRKPAVFMANRANSAKLHGCIAHALGHELIAGHPPEVEIVSGLPRLKNSILQNINGPRRYRLTEHRLILEFRAARPD